MQDFNKIAMIIVDLLSVGFIAIGIIGLKKVGKKFRNLNYDISKEEVKIILHI